MYRHIELDNGILLTLPKSLNVTSSFVAEEQGAWFEDETKFLTEVVAREGDTVVDVGASFGFYTTGFAKTVGEKGRVISFEPSPTTAAALRRTISLNNFDDTVTVVQKAASLKDGTLCFESNLETPELNKLCDSGSTKVPCTSLDSYISSTPLDSVSVVKLDCEGAEADVLLGGKMFFTTHSPVIMWEVNHVGEMAFHHIETLAEMGYKTVRYLPAGYLVPFTPGTQQESYLLNLFSAKQTTLDDLKKRGLYTGDDLAADGDIFDVTTATVELKNWFSTRAFSSELVLGWDRYSHAVDEVVTEGVWRYYMSCKESLTAVERFGYLKGAVEAAQKAAEGVASIGRMCFLARCCGDVGRRQDLVGVLEEAGRRLDDRKGEDEGLRKEYFLPPVQWMDGTKPSLATLESWCEASVRVAYVTRSSFSTGFMPPPTLANAITNLRTVITTGYHLTPACRILKTLSQKSDQVPPTLHAPSHGVSPGSIVSSKVAVFVGRGVEDYFWAGWGAEEVVLVCCDRGLEGDAATKKLAARHLPTKFTSVAFDSFDVAVGGVGVSDTVLCMGPLDFSASLPAQIPALSRITSKVLHLTLPVHSSPEAVIALERCNAGSIRHCPTPSAITELLKLSGFKQIRHELYASGGMAAFLAEK